MIPFFNGILTGLTLQLAVGPVFFFIFTIVLESSYLPGLSAVAAATLVDYLYIGLSVLGVGKLLKNGKRSSIAGVISALILILFGITTVYSGITSKGIGTAVHTGWTPLKSFTSCLILTLSSPLTIVFWGSVFSAKVLQKQYTGKELAFFGLGAGSATFLFLGMAMFFVSLLKTAIPLVFIKFMNGTVGCILICYGVKRIVNTVSSKT